MAMDGCWTEVKRTSNKSWTKVGRHDDMTTTWQDGSRTKIGQKSDENLWTDICHLWMDVGCNGRSCDGR
jgi:hypothetical protein